MSEETVPQMRERIEALEKQVKEEADAKSAAESKARLYEARDAFRGKGLKAEYAELFISNHSGDVTEEAVNGFVEKFGFKPETAPTPPAEEGSTVKNVTGSTALSNMSGAGSRPGDGGQQTPGEEAMTRQDWNELNKKDRVAARAVLARGGVQIRKDNIYARETN